MAILCLCLTVTHISATRAARAAVAGDWGEDIWNDDEWIDDGWEGDDPNFTPHDARSGGMMQGFTPPQPQSRTGRPPIPGTPSTVDAKNRKAVWLGDSTLGMPFCRLIIPERWTAEGNVYWNPNTPMSAIGIWIRVTDPDTNTSAELLVPVGEFTWNEMKASVARGMIRDGTFETDTGVYNLRYRNAQSLLQEFLLPAVTRMTPGARIVGDPQRDATEESRLQQAAQNLAGQAAGIVNVTGSEGTSAYAIVEHGNATTMIGCGSYGYSSVSSVPYMGTFTIYNWRWDNIYTVTAPKGRQLSRGMLEYLDKNMVINPQWLNATQQRVFQIQQNYRRVIIRINEQARAAMRRSGDIMEQNADRWSRYILDQSVWADSQGQTYLAPNSGTYGYITGFGDTLVLSDTEVLGANLHSLKPLTQID